MEVSRWGPRTGRLFDVQGGSFGSQTVDVPFRRLEAFAFLLFLDS